MVLAFPGGGVSYAHPGTSQSAGRSREAAAHRYRTALAAAYFLVAAESYLSTHARGVFRLSFAGFGPTELRIVLAAGAVIVVHKPWVEVFGVQARLFDVGGLVAIASMVVAFTIAAIGNTRALYLAEPVPTRAPRLAPGPTPPRNDVGKTGVTRES